MLTSTSDVVPAEEVYDGWTRINAVDVLNAITILILAVLVALFRRQLGEQALWLAGVLACVVSFVALTTFLADRRPFWRFVHDFSPAPIVLVVFNAIGPLIERANSTRWDATFARLDARLFGAVAAMWRGVLGRPAWFTDVAYVAYCGYYVAPIVLAMILYRREPPQEFRTFVFTVVLTFYAAYVGYFLFPTEGPRPPVALEGAIIGGGALSHAIRAFINFAERNRTDAFPSGHTAGALVFLYFAWRASRAIFIIFLAVAAGIIFSTVYLHYHYVVDVVAGAALACACAWLGPRLEPLLEPEEVVKRLALRLGIR